MRKKKSEEKEIPVDSFVSFRAEKIITEDLRDNYNLRGVFITVSDTKKENGKLLTDLVRINSDFDRLWDKPLYDVDANDLIVHDLKAIIFDNFQY